MSLIAKFERYSLRFGDALALRDINVEFEARKISAIVGRSGSGKTALLRSINRLNDEFASAKSEGVVFASIDDCLVDNRSVDLRRLRTNFAMLFQTPELFDMSIFDNLSVVLREVKGLSKRETAEAIEETLVMVGLFDEVKDRLKSNALELSGGQRQRLCLARSLALKPACLLLDEPTASLDIRSTALIESLLERLELSIVMVSHSLDQALRLADRLYLCDRGALREISADNATDLARQISA
ncbi:MAG: phosphate ABC transporter ATP-binding protein [Helicobacteraceae bacterium]|jgi:phosphate transport system ATP-binding protein|nr:phosphate ABC transporter ATP-binding protein [Helicobacteraceae bacterium]